MFASIFSAIAAIPEILKAIQQLIAYLDKMDKAGFFNAVSKMQQDIEKAKSEEDYNAAAKEIGDALKKF